MKKMNKMRFLAKTIISSFVLLAIFTACEVGLGSNVDTAAPKIEILSPEPSSTHKGEFQITGTASDEIAVRSVSVNLLENGTARYSYNANYDAASGKWSVSIPTLDENNKPIVEDLKYEIQAIATDTDGKTSVATRSVQVDNSAPTVLVTSPSLFNENKSTFFRQLRVSGSAYDASEISSVKVYFYSMEDFQDGTSFDYAHTDKYVVYNAEGTNTWNLTVDLLQNDVFFENGKVYHFFVIAEDTAGNKNTYFYRMGDFYRDEVISDTTPGDSDNYIPFPSMVQIGKFDQGLPVENPTSGLTAEGLERIRKECSAIESNDSNFLYRSEAASNVSWGNIVSVETKNENGQIEIGPRAIPLGTDVTGQIKSTDGTTVMQDEVEFWLSNMDDENKVWKIRPNNIKLDTSETTTIFTVTLHDKNEEDISDTEELPPLKSGNYKIEVKYKTVASQNSDKLSAEQIFGVSAGMPKLTETKLTGKDPSPINVQKYSNKPVSLGGIAVKGDGNPINEIETTYNGQKISFPGTIYDGIWELEISEEGSHTYEFKVTDAGTSSSLNRTVIIDKTYPKIENMSFYQSADKKTVTISALVTDENSFEKIEYAFVEGKIESETELAEEDWKEAEKKNSLNIELDASDFGSLEFQQGPWTMWIKVSDPAGNEKIEKYSGILDLEAPEFSNNFKTTTIPENGYLNKAFYYVDSELSDDIVATDNNEISKIEIVAKKDGKVSDTLSATKTINKKELKKSDVINLPVIKAISENEGKWIITFTLYDLNNNKVEKTVDFSMDVTSPKGEITVLPSPKSDKGKVEFGGTASDTLSGIDKVVIKYEDKEIECAGGTSWRGELDISKEGSGSVGAIIYDRAGNTFETNREFNIDFNNPTLTINSKTEVQTKETEYILSGAAEDSLAIEKIEITATKNGETQTGEGESDGIWKTFPDVTDVTDEKKITIPENTNLLPSEDPEGKWIFTIKAYDKVGRVSEPSIINILVDRGAPDFKEAKITSDSTEIEGKTWYKGQTIKLEGQLTEGNGIESIEYFIGEANGVSCGYKIEGDTYNFSANIPVDSVLAEAEQITIRAIDTFGNESKYTVENVYVDIGNPTIEILDDVSNIFLKENDNLKVKLKATDDESGVASVKARFNRSESYNDDIKVEPTSEEFEFEISSDKIKGETVYLQVEDNCGNTFETSFQFRRDSEPPKVKITSHSDGDTVNGKITLSGATTETQGLAKVEIFAVDTSDTLLETFEGNAGFNWSCEIDTTKIYNETDTKALPIKVIATDNAGNESDAQEITLEIDQKSDRPTITVRDIGLSGEKQYLGQKTISFTVEDDDGPIEKFEISENNSNWNPVELKNGSYNYTLVDDGDYELSFRVTEYKENPKSPDVVFETSSKNNALTEPVLKHEAEVSDSTLKFTLDTKLPEIKSGSKISFDEGTSSKFDNGIKIGGAKKAFTINVGVKDASGIQAVVLKVGENFTREGSSQGAADENGFETWEITISETECKEFDNGNVQFDLEVKDNAGSTTKVTKVLLVDNDKPSITVESPTNMTQVTSSVRISGSTTDDVNEDKNVTSSGISSVKYLITELTNVYDDSTLKLDYEIINLSEWQDVNGTSYWNFSINVDDYVKKENDKWTSNFAFKKGNDIFELPIFFLITDNVGNQHLEKGYTLLLDPEGDKPVASITYPTDGAILGGQIRVFGTADDNINVTNVYMQIDVNDNDADVVDKTWLADKTKTENGELKNLYNIVELSDGDWGIKLNGTSSWNLLINTTDEFTNASIEKISLRVKAFDGEKYGNWTDWIDITIDGEAPKIGSHVPPRLVQYDESGNEIASVQYVADMWISGDWYLETSVMDNEGIGSIETKESNFNDLKDISILGNPEYSKEYIENSDSGYIIKLPLKTSGKTEGNISFKISAIEKSDQNITSTYPISIKYDNSAPTLDGKLYSSKQEIGLGEGKNTIQDSDGQYEISSTVKEAGSGFQKLAVYFVREDSNGNKRIYNPRYAKETDGNRIDISKVGEGEGKVSGNVYIDEKDGLPRLYINNATIKDGSIISYPGLGENPNIYEGRIVRIKGVDRKITSISGDEATFTPEISAGYKDDDVEAEFAYALIVDNFMKDKTSDDDEVTQDGDYIEETIIKTGEKYDCSLIFNSKNIPDGPITICYVAYDEAGNCSMKESVSTKIENNPPAIAKVWLGTDLNGDTKITEDEEVTVYGDNYDPETFDPLATENRNISIDATTKFTAKDKTTIRADIVGGNNALYYYFGYYSKIEEKEIENVFENHKATELSKGNGNYLITLTSEDLKSFDSKTGDFFVEYWDSTEETIYNDSDKSNNTSQWAKMEVKFMVDVVDSERPTVKIYDLYWNSKSDNSIVKTEKGENDGHIDLKGDLPSANFGADLGVYDKDDKVSGKIIFKGTVSDNVRLSNLNFTFETKDKTYITETLIYDSINKKWSESSSVLKDGYELKLDNSTLDQNGHNVTWTLTIDTEKNGIVAAADVNLVVEAIDHSTNNASDSKQVDVVPYITGVQTALSTKKGSNPSIVNRTALGHYSVNAGESVLIYGFNLTGAKYDADELSSDLPDAIQDKKDIADENMEMALNYYGFYSNRSWVVLDVSQIDTSGPISLFVNGVETLNNLNDSDAKGSCTKDLNQTNYAEYAYNRQPNGDNNELLDDDVYFDIWQFNDVVEAYDGGYCVEPVMKINPIDGRIGFAFANGSAYFSMSDGQDTSYSLWQRNFAKNIGTGFVYDAAGNSHGITIGLDTNPNSGHAGRMTYMTSLWGVGNTSSQDGNYNGDNTIRLESIGVPANNNAMGETINKIMEERFPSLSLATTMHGGIPTVYYAYYDDLHQAIRFRYGTNEYDKKTSFGQFVDQVDYNNASVTTNAVFDAYRGNYSIVVDSTSTYKPGNYVSLDALTGTSTADDVVVLAWYDATNNRLMYSYKENPCNDNDGFGSGDGSWSQPIVVMREAGEYCKIKIDLGGGVHIAAYTGDDLIYAHLDNYANDSFTVSRVDTFEDAGENITLDIAKSGDNWIPYIGYYSNYVKGNKLAYLISSDSLDYGDCAGAVTEKYTQNWEISVIPTTSLIRKDHVNVGVWKDQDGIIKESVEGTPNTNKTKGASWGNGTANPVLGYAIRVGTTGHIETAQLK
ncbi:MAG: Ig-like domain repeat protein [Spirochaetaceae bacterium]|nr:Ig-like domain repeat protein [Spirochaetaceae bacterium]